MCLPLESPLAACLCQAHKKKNNNKNKRSKRKKSKAPDGRKAVSSFRSSFEFAPTYTAAETAAMETIFEAPENETGK